MSESYERKSKLNIADFFPPFFSFGLFFSAQTQLNIY